MMSLLTIDPTTPTPEALRDEAAAALVHLLAALTGRQPEFGNTRPYHRAEGLTFECVSCLAGAYACDFLDAAGRCPECRGSVEGVKKS